MGTALSTFYRVPYVEFDERIVPPPDLMKDLKLEYLKTNYWLLLRREEDGSIVVLIDNPQDLQKVDSVNQLLPRQRIRFAVGLRKDIITFLTAASGEVGARDTITEIIGDLTTEDAEKVEEAVGGDVDENDSTVVRLANQVIVDAYKARACARPHQQARPQDLDGRGPGRDHPVRSAPGPGPTDLKEHPEQAKTLERHHAVPSIVAGIGITIADVQVDDVRRSHDIKKRFGFLTNDAVLVATMERLEITALASIDGDFTRVDGLTVYQPSPSP